MRKHKKKTFLYLFLAIFICFTFSTIAYSAISSTMNISGDAVARVDADVRTMKNIVKIQYRPKYSFSLLKMLIVLHMM